MKNLDVLIMALAIGVAVTLVYFSAIGDCDRKAEWRMLND